MTDDLLCYAPTDVALASELGRACGVSPVIAQLLLHRGVSEPQKAERFLFPKLAHLTSPEAMVDRALAAQRIARAITRGERIIVFGDYDVDGTTSAAILSGIIRTLGGRVNALVGNRFTGGYGLSEVALQRVLAERAELLITCDCGSSDHARVKAARALGIDVIVVDHHLVPEEPLAALAFLNPHRPECGFPFKGLCSAGLALSLGAALRTELKVNLDLRSWLDLVALGTIADVAPLQGDNRALVRAGLALLAAESARPGIVALREAAKVRQGATLSAIDVAFRLTPRLNAAGRLGDPAITLSLLNARDIYEARAIAADIERMNDERKKLEQQITAQAFEQTEPVAGSAHGVVAAAQGWHRGVVGITAARLVDKLAKPALAIALDGELGHGSGRAPDGFPLHAALSRVGHLLDKFGGHDAAVGLTVRRDRIDALRIAFDQACAELSTASTLVVPERTVDARLGDGFFAPPRASELTLLEPLGETNPDPLYQIDGDVLRAQVVGEQHLKLSLRVCGRELGAFGYLQGTQAEALDGARVRVLGNLRPDGFRGGENIEIRVQNCALLSAHEDRKLKRPVESIMKAPLA